MDTVEALAADMAAFIARGFPTRAYANWRNEGDTDAANRLEEHDAEKRVLLERASRLGVYDG